jgi:hypothetical protein
MPKKFKDTDVGKFLLNKIPTIVGKIAGSDMSDADKEIALKKLEIERAEIDGTTRRWVADARSGFWLTSNVRPLILILITFSIILGFFLKYDVTSLTDLGKIIFSAYFGSRGIEKVFGNNKHQ